MEDIWNCLYELRPLMFMVTVQVVLTGVNVLYKLAVNDGMSLRVIVAYRFVFAAVVMVPLALIVERKRPKLTWTVLFQAFLCGLLGGSLFQNLYLESLDLTSATFATTMFNLIPAMTFVLAVCFRMEKLSLNTRAGKAKVLGTLVGICGAMLLTFFKGIQLNIWSSHLDLLHHHGQAIASLVASSHAASLNLALGTLAALGSCVSYVLWLIVQAKMSEKYPCHYTSTALMCVMAAVQSLAYALCIKKDWSQWRLGWNIRLLTVVYAGIFATGLMFVLIFWCVQKKGPLYASIFNPLALVLVAFAGSLFLEEKLYLGSILGAVLIVLGLYVVLWGKAKEMKKMKKMTQLMPSTSPLETEPIEIIVTSSTSLEGLSEGLEGKEANNRRDAKEEKEVMDVEN